MSRPISEFPQEVLQEIFKYVKGKDAARCRRVCSGWLQAIDNFTDKDWKEFCFQEVGECFETYKKANITWRELYKCLALWPKLPSAKMCVKKIHCPEMEQFCICQDRLGISQCDETKWIGPLRANYRRNCDTIVYYDLHTLEKKTETIIFDFEFDTYSENDKFIVVIEVSCHLCVIPRGACNFSMVIPKSTMEKVFVGTLPELQENDEFEYTEIDEYSLFENSVYFKNSDNFICMSKLVDVDGRATLVTESLCELRDEIVTMKYVNEKNINILTNTGAIYSMKQNELMMATLIVNACNVPLQLKRYGFDWSRKSVYEWIVTFFSGEVRIAEMNDSFWSLGDIVIRGTKQRAIKIYHNPYALAARLELNNIKPTHSIYLNNLLKFHVPYDMKYWYNKIDQIDVVEIPNGHKVIVSAAKMLIVLEFVHEWEERKRKGDVNDSERNIKRKKTV